MNPKISTQTKKKVTHFLNQDLDQFTATAVDPTKLNNTPYIEFFEIILNDQNQQILDQFWILKEQIGDGSFSRVRRTQHKKSQEEFGLKIYDKVVLDSQRKINYETNEFETNLVRLTSEIEIWTLLSHKHVCGLYQIYEMEGEPKVYLVMDLGEEGELASFLPSSRTWQINKFLLNLYEDSKREGKLTKLGYQLVFSQMIEAVEHLHSLKIAHRDLKPQNFVVKKWERENEITKEKYTTFRILLIDFNSAKIINSDPPLVSETEGTVQFNSPEVIFEIQNGIDPFVSDVWSLGVCFYSFVVGKLPFDVEGEEEEFVEMEVNMKIKKQAIDTTYIFGEDLEDLLVRMLEKDPKKRISLKEVKNHKYFCRK